MSKVTCSISATLDVVGDRWTLLILRNLFRGVRRFERIQKDLGIARNLLADRLQRLNANEIIIRVPYQDHPVRYDYRLTPKGLDLSSALIALMQWGDQWYANGDPPTLLTHAKCKTPVKNVVICSDCGLHIQPKEIRSQSGMEESINSPKVGLV